MARETAHILLNESRLNSFADYGASTCPTRIGRRIVAQLAQLSNPDASRQDVQSCTESITKELLSAVFNRTPDQPVLLLPVLRAGVAMWSQANRFFDYPESSFLIGQKEKGTDAVSVTWPKKTELDTKHVLILEPIIATGDTLTAASNCIGVQCEQPGSLTVLSCYASPEGVEAVLEATDANIVVGCMAETVDTAGYLVPSTNGDMGDKLFGAINHGSVQL